MTRWNLGHTLARAREGLDATTAVRSFLVVHTYRVHGPMRVGPDEDGKPWREILAKVRARRLASGAIRGSEGEDDDLGIDPEHEPAPDPEIQGAGLRFYHDAVNDLDAKVGASIDELDGAGWFERGVLALTADHGNAYGENGELWGHGGDLYDVKLSVPLLLAGRGIEPRAVRGVVSLIDLAPTLADLARAEPSPSWLGRSLLSGDPARPAYAFDLKRAHQQVALFAEGRKLMAPDVAALHAGTPTHAFDLGADPARRAQPRRGAGWPGRAARTLAASLERLLVPAAEGRTLELPSEVQAELRRRSATPSSPRVQAPAARAFRAARHYRMRSRRPRAVRRPARDPCTRSA